MASQLSVITVCITLCIATCARGFATCPLHGKTDDGQLSFVELEDPVVIGFEKLFKSIGCKSSNYCNITWTKDGWPVNETSTVQIRDQQQKLTFKQLTLNDTGLYSCEASNGRESIKQTIYFNVISADCDTELRPIDLQYESCRNLSAHVGDDVRFDCRFYVGLQGDSEGYWFKLNESAPPEADDYDRLIDLRMPLGGTVFNMSDYRVGEVPENVKHCGCSDCLPVFGTSLSAPNITAEAYGSYVVYVLNSGLHTCVMLEISPAPITAAPVVKPSVWHHFLTIPLASVLGVCLVALLGWHRFKVDIKLKVKDFAGKKDRSKANDVYLSYDWTSDTDRAFAIGLAQCLGELGYKVFFEVNLIPGGDTDSDIVEALETSHRCVIIFSPDYLASHRNLDVVFAMDNAKHYKKEIIPIVYRDISAASGGEDQGALVRQILSLPCLRYDRLRSPRPAPLGKLQKIAQSVFPDRHSEKSLQKELLLRLPPRDKPSRRPAIPSIASDSDLIPSEIPPHESSRESLSLYPPIADLSQRLDFHVSSGILASVNESPRTVFIPNGTKLYPDINGFANSAESTYF